MSIFSNIGPWLNDAVAEVERIEAKAEAELTAAEVYIKQNAPILAQAVDGFLTTAEAVTNDVDPAASGAVEGLKTLFDGLIRLIEGAAGPATEGASIVLPTDSIVKEQN